MKNVRINSQQVGLVYRKGDYKRVIFAGTHWLMFGETYKVFNKMAIYNVLDDMETLVKSADFAKSIVQFNVKENEIAMMFTRGNYKSLFRAGNFFYFKSEIDIKIEIFDLNATEDIKTVDQAILRNTEVVGFVKNYKVESYEKGLFFQEGNFVKELTSGTYYFWNGAKQSDLLKADLRNTTMEISGQELLTKDKAALRVNFQLDYKVIDALKAMLENRDYQKQLYSRAQLALREYIGSLTLDELLMSKEKVGEYVSFALKSCKEKLGVEVSSAGIRDVILPGEIKEIMNQVLIAEKQAQANSISRREEAAATRNMLNTAKLMEENAILFKLKEMEYVEKIASKIGEINLSNGGNTIEQLKQLLI